MEPDPPPVSRAAEAARRLTAARARLVLGRDARSVFFASLALRLELVADPRVLTAATDGRVLAFSPEFVVGLSADELLGVVAHEVMHNALAHAHRRGGRGHARWNVACDLAVNPILLGAGFTLPLSRLNPGEGPHARLAPGKSAEEYYSLLEADGGRGGASAASTTPPQGPGDSQESPGPQSPPPDRAADSPTAAGPTDPADPGGCGGVCDPQRDSGGDVGSESAWRAAVAQAREACEGCGDLPAGLARAVDAISPRPRADWRSALRAFVSETTRADHSWSRPNRRFVAQGLYLPGLRSETLGAVAIALDASGSVGPKMLALFTSEVAAILGACECDAVVLCHDVEVTTVATWYAGDPPPELEIVGGGGTSHGCVFDWLAASGQTYACAVCLTDLDTRFPRRTPAVPVLWATTGGLRPPPPFGEVIHLGD